MKNLTFQETSLWLCLFAILATYTIYYMNISPPFNGNMSVPHVFQFIFYMVIMVGFIVISHIVLAIMKKQEKVDERAKLIVIKANSVSSYLLAIGMFTATMVALMIPGNFWVIHTLSLFWVLTEVINMIQQLCAFKKGC